MKNYLYSYKFSAILLYNKKIISYHFAKSELDPQKNQQDIPVLDNNEPPNEEMGELVPPSPFDESESPTFGEISPLIFLPPFSSLKKGSDFAPSNLIFPGESIDNQISYLKQQKSRLKNHLLQLWQKTQSYYKRAEELDSSKSQ